MEDDKHVNVSLGDHFNLSKAQASKAENEKAFMSNVPYASIVGKLMNVMVCTRLDIAQAVRVVKRYMSNPGQEQ